MLVQLKVEGLVLSHRRLKLTAAVLCAPAASARGQETNTAASDGMVCRARLRSCWPQMWLPGAWTSWGCKRSSTMTAPQTCAATSTEWDAQLEQV